jgi:hypothetical protein
MSVTAEVNCTAVVKECNGTSAVAGVARNISQEYRRERRIHIDIINVQWDAGSLRALVTPSANGDCTHPQTCTDTKYMYVVLN